jgi:hypothetical protein
VWRLYAALAGEAGLEPAVPVEDAQVFTDQLAHADGTVYTWVVSTSPDEKSVTPRLAAGGKLADAVTGEPVPDVLTLPPFGIRVLRHVAR